MYRMSKPTLIGEGTYGCVYRPAINCENASNTGIDKKVSKVMKTAEANLEYSEYDQIGNADPQHKYYLGKPQMCTMSDADYKANVEQSGCRILTPNSTYTDYTMLQYEDGGTDLETFAIGYLKTFLASDKQKHTDLFWLNAHSLFMGLKMFAENDILHDDVKPQNIVLKYDLTKDVVRFNYIDFGLMKTRSAELARVLQRGKNDRLFHWSRPFEQGCMTNELHYTTLYNYAGPGNVVDHYTKLISDIIVKKKNKNILHIHPAAFLLTFKCMENVLSPNTSAVITANIRSCIESIVNCRPTPNEFVKKSIETTDSYCLGFTLNYIANEMYKKQALANDEYLRLHNLFKKMFDLDIIMRMSNLETIINEYESVLFQNGVLSRLNKKIVNHEIVNQQSVAILPILPTLSKAQAHVIGAQSPPKSVVQSPPKSASKSPPKSASKSLSKSASKSPVKSASKSPAKSASNSASKSASKSSQKSALNMTVKNTKPCPPGQERNPATGRCRKSQKPCPPGQERNPVTRRCRKI